MDLNTAIDVIESVAGFADADTSVGEAWAVVMAQLNAAPAPAGEVAKLVQPPGRAGLTWQGVIEGLRDVLNDESEDAIQRVWQRSRILDAISVMEANPCPAPVRAGEVAELVAWLRAWARGTLEKGQPATSRSLTRAADLLVQRHPAPVPVAERLPGLEDCDAEHYCWRWNKIGRLWARQPLARSWYEFESHWLPATALPLPSGGGPAMSKPPLWEVMRAAYNCSTAANGSTDDWTALDGYAAEIRALRDWLVPEEPPPHRGMRPGGTNLTYQETLSVERQHLRAMLTAEVDRAERGEVDHA